MSKILTIRAPRRGVTFPTGTIRNQKGGTKNQAGSRDIIAFSLIVTHSDSVMNRPVLKVNEIQIETRLLCHITHCLCVTDSQHHGV